MLAQGHPGKPGDNLLRGGAGGGHRRALGRHGDLDRGAVIRADRIPGVAEGTNAPAMRICLDGGQVSDGDLPDLRGRDGPKVRLTHALGGRGDGNEGKDHQRC